jgi:hypothetical protein
MLYGCVRKKFTRKSFSSPRLPDAGTAGRDVSAHPEHPAGKWWNAADATTSRGANIGGQTSRRSFPDKRPFSQLSAGEYADKLSLPSTKGALDQVGVVIAGIAGNVHCNPQRGHLRPFAEENGQGIADGFQQ